MKGCAYVMNSYRHEIVKAIIDMKKYDVFNEYCEITNPKRNGLMVSEYAGKDIRVFKDHDTVKVLCPKNMTYVQESNLTKAIATGTIFDEADEVDGYAKHIVLTKMPCEGMLKHGLGKPEKMTEFVGATIGRMNEAGDVDVSDEDVDNGKAMMDDLLELDSKEYKDVKNLVDDFVGNDEHEYCYSKDIACDIDQLRKEIQDFNDADVSPEDSINDEDWDDSWADGVNGSIADDSDFQQEAFFSKKPKKLKPIPIRDIVSYITVEMNAIQDSNDQAMLSGYTCSKLELVDFYLNCIDTHDDRYIVPHTREYLVDGQKQLSNLLTQILRIRPINKNDRVWKINYPSDYRG